MLSCCVMHDNTEIIMDSLGPYNMLLLVFPGIRFNDQVSKVKVVMSETDCDYKLRFRCTAFIDSAIMKIRRWRYTKFAKIWALPEGAP